MTINVCSALPRVSGPEGRPTPLAVLIAVALSVPTQAQARDEFNVRALEIDNPMSVPADLSRFTQAGGQAPGDYRVDIYINGEPQDTQNIKFVAGKGGRLQPELTPAQLADWGVNLASLPAFQGVAPDTSIDDLEKYIPQATTHFDFSRQRLEITVPQASMNLTAQGAVDPKYWDNGVPALLLGYSFTGGNSWSDGNSGRNDSYFLNLRSGINLGAWRLRNYSTWNYSSGGNNRDGAQSQWDSINTYLQRDVPVIKGQLTLGDSYTPSDVFDSLQFRGAQLASDDNMLPDSLRGFAPTVRGIANSNARVTIRQNGTVIYQTYVPPGAFTINDLYPTSASGDLQVTITEADGSERSFIQPFANVPVMQREGRAKYAFTVGKYRAPNHYNEEPILGQATLIYGLPHDVTAYGGFQTSDDYNALAFGLGFGLGELGSISLDATQAYTTLSDGSNKEGQSYRFQYSKSIAATDSTVTLAGYRYSTKGFYTFSEAMDYQAFDNSNYFNMRNNKRSKLQLNLTQNLMGGEWGALSFSGYQQDYWNAEGYERNLSVGYNNGWNGINYSLLYTYSAYPGRQSDNNQQLALNVSIPLSRWLPNAYANTSATVDKSGRARYQAGFSGSALADNNLNYSVMESYGTHGEGNSGSLNGNYRGPYAQVNGGYNYSRGYQQLSYGLQGAVVAHPYGVTLSQPLSGDMAALALVRAPGAGDAKVQNQTGVYTDWRGYAVVPYLTPYKRSRVVLDPASFGNDVDIDTNVQSVVPTAGALVLASFNTRVGGRVLMTLLQNGRPIPFGATVSLDGENAGGGIVGDGGQVYLSGVPQQGSLTAKWGNGAAQQCRATFKLPDEVDNKKQSSSVIHAQTQCL
ncbi:fimbrial biogenesis outer membrane usher protein [Serratia rubidaea]|uniref:fimbria/pilus outer membrane usher protein n=1 Tax=Serratia rubidaea TaxID=61652 RepID=UPI001F1AFC40|nr:fimbria/pilus outer membrane usher protein [Serratia rubidaea]UJD81799.1 fimbrial biogenesis outer membrane usher protein [Serratia rubidaea]UJD86362.1 fimbrial biogenesis outer membrane usher protein [Serratia rubidaea]